MLSCCFSESNDTSQQITYGGVSDPRMEEGKPGQVSYGIPQINHSGPGVSGYGGSASDTPPSTARSLTPEEKQREKERLQEMVKEFAKSVVQGQPAEWIDDSRDLAEARPMSVTYFIDKSLKVFSIATVREGGETQPVRQIDMTQIIDIVKDVHQTPLAFLLSSPTGGITHDVLQRHFIAVQHQGENREVRFLGLLMPNPYERERFYTCMKILRWAMDSRKAQS